VISTSNKIF